MTSSVNEMTMVVSLVNHCRLHFGVVQVQMELELEMLCLERLMEMERMMMI